MESLLNMDTPRLTRQSTCGWRPGAFNFQTLCGAHSRYACRCWNSSEWAPLTKVYSATLFCRLLCCTRSFSEQCNSQICHPSLPEEEKMDSLRHRSLTCKAHAAPALTGWHA